MDLWWSRRRSSCVWRVERCVLWRQLQIREPGWSLMESWWGSHGRSFTLGGMFLSTGLRKCILCRVLLDYYRPELNACTIYKLTPFLIFNLLLIKYNDDHEDLVMRSTQPKLGAGFRSVPVYFVCLKHWWLSLLWSLFIIWWVPFLAVLCDWCEEMKPLSWCDIMCVLSFFFFFFLAAPLSLWYLMSPTRDWTRASALKALSLNHWATREFPNMFFLFSFTDPLNFHSGHIWPEWCGNNSFRKFAF